MASTFVMVPHPGAVALCILCAFACGGRAETIRVLKFSEAKSFRMGKVTSARIVHPEMGARRITLNYSVSEPGNEFAQHVHDNSDDTILILEGQGDMRQGGSRRPFHAGQSAFVPAGQIHGTITTGAAKATMISFQTPPDMALYTGARDSSKPGAPPPQGAITPGAVKFIDFANQSGFFVHPRMGAQRVAVARRKLKPGEKFQTATAPGGEQVLFVWKGAVSVTATSGTYRASERDAVFIGGPGNIDVRNDSSRETVLIQAQAPPQPGR